VLVLSFLRKLHSVFNFKFMQPGNFQKPSLSFVCPADWSKMKPCEQGRLCGSCQKTVVDFTQKSDAEILEMLSKREEKVCGRFYAHQLNRPVRKGFSFQRIFSSALLLFGVGCQSHPNLSVETYLTGEIIPAIENEQVFPVLPPISTDDFNRSSQSKGPVHTKW